uniref:E3 ubiquitin-protein ligase CBL n=1 Tax=Panagrellus redivivus TaxID=6233 RepID=A0A7E4VMB4_PANRE
MSNIATSFMRRLHGLLDGTASNGTVAAVMDWMSPEGSVTVSTVPITSNAEDRKLLERTYKQMELVLRSCQQPKLNLKNSPPFIVDILPRMSQLISQIIATDSDALQKIEYLQVFIHNLLTKCKETQKLFRSAEIYVEDSSARGSLSVQSLVFSHMLYELRAFFPDNKFIGNRYRITKKEAASFWKDHFGDRALVPWEEFREEFGRVHKLKVGSQTHALLQTIDLTKNNYISAFEFDVFTRLFHPWATIIQNWECLVILHPAYCSFITYEEVKRKLQRFTRKPGSYVFRLSCTRLGQWAIGYVAKDNGIYQTIPSNKTLVQSLVDGHRDGFYIYPMGKDKNLDISYMLDTTKTEDRLKVTSEQYQIYCEMGSTFEICKICDERDKDVKLEPCGHLLCKPCLTSWQDSADSAVLCPFCRCEIKGNERIVIETYHPAKQAESATPPEMPDVETMPTSSRTSVELPEVENRPTPPVSLPPVPPKRKPPPHPPALIPSQKANNQQPIDEICAELSTIDFSIQNQ